MGRTVTLPIRLELHVLVRAAEIVVFPEPGVPAKAMRMRRRDEAGFSSSRRRSLSHNIATVSSIWPTESKIIVTVEMRKENGIHDADIRRVLNLESRADCRIHRVSLLQLRGKQSSLRAENSRPWAENSRPALTSL